MSAMAKFEEVLLKDTVNFTNKAVYYIGAASGYIICTYEDLKVLVYERMKIVQGLKVKHLVRSNLDEKVDQQTKDFYFNLGQDLVKKTKENLEGDNLIIIDASKY